MGIPEDLQDFGRGFPTDSQGFARLWERIWRICETLGRFVRLWERIHEDWQGFGRGFMRICETLGEDL